MIMSSFAMDRGITKFVACDPARIRIEQGEVSREVLELAEARKKGLLEAEAKYRAELAAVKAKYEKRFEGLENSVNLFLDSFERKVVDQLIELSVHIAEAIIRQKLPDREMLKGVIEEVLSPITDIQGVRIRMNEADAIDIKALRAEKQGMSVIDNIEIVADKSLSQGDVMIESRNGYFDARVSERLSLLEDHLRERMRNAS